MTPIGPVSAASDSIVEHINRRSYPFTVLPTQKQQTFTTPTISLVPPFVRFVQGATLESNKLYEAAIEQADINGFQPMGPSGSAVFGGVGASALNYKLSFDCLISALYNSSTMDAASFIGIELFSQMQAPLINNPATPSIQLKWQLKDQTQWTLSFYAGGGAAGVHRNFTLPASQGAGGHKTRLLWDPYELTVAAYVDDVLRVKQSVAGISAPSLDTYAGILLFTGTVLAVSPVITAFWMGANIATYDLHTTGAGVF